LLGESHVGLITLCGIYLQSVRPTWVSPNKRVGVRKREFIALLSFISMKEFEVDSHLVEILLYKISSLHISMIFSIRSISENDVFIACGHSLAGLLCQCRMPHDSYLNIYGRRIVVGWAVVCTFRHITCLNHCCC